MSSDNKIIDAFFNKNLDYQTTDYADIGDSESDPFLRKMINLGFVEHGSSGMYDAQGNDIGGEHHHWICTPVGLFQILNGMWLCSLGGAVATRLYGTNLGSSAGREAEARMRGAMPNKWW